MLDKLLMVFPILWTLKTSLGIEKVLDLVKSDVDLFGSVCKQIKHRVLIIHILIIVNGYFDLVQ